MTDSTISAEVHFCHQLASNQKNIRNRCLKKLKRYLITKSSASNAFTENDMLILWKGLYYFLWMCDKPLVQEEMAEEISQLIHCFLTLKHSFLFIDTFLQTMSREWFGIDQYRLEKFMMFVRKFLHQSFMLLMKRKWKIQHIKRFGKIIKKSVSNPNLGFQLHVIDMYLEELAKVGGRKLSPKRVRLFLVPFSQQLAETKSVILQKSICKDIFCYLINQEEEEDEDDEISILKFNSKAIQRMLIKLEKKVTEQRNRRAIYKLVQNFQDYSEGAYAYDITQDMYKKGPGLRKRDVVKASASLYAEDVAFRQEKLSHKNKKHKKHTDCDSLYDCEDVL